MSLNFESEIYLAKTEGGVRDWCLLEVFTEDFSHYVK